MTSFSKQDSVIVHMFINLITHGCLNCSHGSGVYVNRFNRDKRLATTTGTQVFEVWSLFATPMARQVKDPLGLRTSLQEVMYHVLHSLVTFLIVFLFVLAGPMWTDVVMRLWKAQKALCPTNAMFKLNLFLFK